MPRVMLIIVLCILLPFSLTACTTDAHELNDWAFVHTIGVDKGVSDQLRFTFQMATYKGSGGGSVSGTGGGSGSQGNKDHAVISIDCPTFYSGINMLNTSLSRTLNFMHSKYLIISEELARDGVERFINGMMRSYQIRRSMYVIIVKGSASDFIKEFNPVIGTSITKTQELIMDHQYETGLFAEVTYNEFSIGLKNTYTQPTAALAAINDFSSFKTGGAPPEEFKSGGDYYAGELPREGGNKYEFFGTALFDGDKMIGELSGDETRAMLMMKGEFQDASIAIPDPIDSKLRLGFYVHQQKKPNIKITFKDGEPVIHVKVSLEGSLQNVQSSTEYEGEELKPVAEKALETFIKDNFDKTIDKCKSLNCEAFGFGETAAMQFLTIQEWEEYNWIAHFKYAEVTTEVEFIMQRTGTIMKTSEINTTEGKKK